MRITKSVYSATKSTETIKIRETTPNIPESDVIVLMCGIAANIMTPAANAEAMYFQMAESVSPIPSSIGLPAYQNAGRKSIK